MKNHYILTKGERRVNEPCSYRALSGSIAVVEPTVEQPLSTSVASLDFPSDFHRISEARVPKSASSSSNLFSAEISSVHRFTSRSFPSGRVRVGFLLLFILLLSIGQMWGAEKTYDFTSGSEGLTISNLNEKSSYNRVTTTTNSIPVCELSGSSGTYFMFLSFSGNNSGVVTIETTESFTNITSITFNSCGTDNNGSPKVAVSIIDTDNKETSVLSATSLSSTKNTWRSQSIDLSSSPNSGKIRFKFTTGSSSKYGGIDDISITYSSTPAPSSNFKISVFNSDGNTGTTGEHNFVAVSGTNEIIIEDFVIPQYIASGDQKQFWVGNGGYDQQHSANEYFSWKRAYHQQNNRCTDNRTLGDPIGAIGTLHAWTNSTAANYGLCFDPKGYGLMWGQEGGTWTSVAFNATSDATVWLTDIVDISSTQISNYKYYVGLLKRDGGYVGSFRSEGNATGLSRTDNLSGMRRKTGSGESDWADGLTAGAGKFRIWVNNCEQNFYCHFIPYYRATFVNNNGSDNTYSDYKSCEETNQITFPSPTKTGYNLVGWYKNGEFSGTKYDAGSTYNLTSSTGSKTFYARWTPKTNTKYVVKHFQQKLDGTYPTDPTDTEKLTGTTGASVTPAVKSYTGFTAPSTQTKEILADGSLVVEYKYTRKSYTLTWNLDGGSIKTAGTPAGDVKFGASLTAPTVEKTGYTSTGWNPEVPATMPANAATYTAQWTENICVVPSITASQLAAANYTVGDEATALSVTATKGDGETQTYQWYKNTTNTATVDDSHKISDATQSSYTPSTETAGTLYYYCVVTNSKTNYTSKSTTSSVSGAITVSAATPTTHTLSSAVSPSGKAKVTLTETTVAEGATATATASDIVNGYEYKQWSISGAGATLSSSSANSTTVTMGTADATVTYTLQPITYNIIYDNLQGTTKAAGTYTVESNDITLTAPTGTYAGHTFGGWYDGVDGTGNLVTKIAKGSTGDQHLYAKWEEIQLPILSIGTHEMKNASSTSNQILGKYDNIFYARSGSGLTIDKTNGAQLDNNEIYVFRLDQKANISLNFYTKNTSQTIQILFVSITDEVYGNIVTLYNNGTNAISYINNAGTSIKTISTTLAQNTTTLSEKVELAAGNYKLWVVSKGSSSGNCIKEIIAESPTTTYTITKASADHGTFTVKAGDTEVSQAAKDTEITLSAAPATGYQFGSWSVYKTSDQSTTVSVSDNKFKMPAYAVTVAATFTPQTYNITYKDQGDVTFSGNHESGYPTQYTYGVGATLKSATKTGYEFGGWHIKSDCTDDPVTSIGTDAHENKTFYAKWTAAVVPVTGVSLNKTTTSIAVGSTETLTATVAPDNATNKNVTWSSDDEDVATVEDGVVTAVAAGTAIVQVKTEDGNFTATCTVTVTSAECTNLLRESGLVETPLAVSSVTTWDLTFANLSGGAVTSGKEYVEMSSSTCPKKDEEFILYNINATTGVSDNAAKSIILVGERLRKDESCFQGSDIKFTTSVAGTVVVKFASNGSSERWATINGTATAHSSSTSSIITSDAIAVSAGEVHIQGCSSSKTGEYLRFKEITFTPSSTPTKHSVTYAKGDEAVTGPVPTQEDVAENASFTVADKGNLAWEGHTFTGWSDGSKTYTAGDSYTMGTSDVTLTAQWTQDQPVGDCTDLVTLTVTGTKSGDITNNGQKFIDFENTTQEYGGHTGYKLGGSKYVGLALESGNFAIGDKVTVYITNLSDQAGHTHLVISEDQAGATVLGTIDNPQLGENEFTLSQAASKIYVARNQNCSQNHYIYSISVCRPSAPAPCTAPTISAHPQSKNYTIGDAATDLSVTATGTTPLSYQWQKSTTSSTTGFENISGATNSTYTPAIDAVGTTYYKVTVTNSCGSATSNVATITVTATPQPGECSGTFNYAYNDATRLVGGVHKNPQGGDVVAKGAALTDPWSPAVTGTGLTSVVFNACKYSAPSDLSSGVPYYSSYIMVPASKTVVITVANGYSGTLKIKAGPESSGSRTVTLKCDGQEDQVQTTTGVRTTENNYGELIFLLHAGANTLSFGSSNTWISAMDICVKSGVTTHTLTIAPAGGTLTNTQGWTPAGDNYTRQVNAGEPFSLPAITRNGYTLVDWTDGAGNHYTDQQLIADGISADATFTANWAIPATGITISPDEIKVEIGGSDVRLYADLTPTGCAPEAIYWSSEYATLATVSNGLVHAVALQDDGSAFQIRANTARLTGSNYYAIVKTYYLVTFDGNNGGKPATASAKYYGGDNKVKLPTVTPSTDASFLGWFDAATDGNKIGDAGDYITLSAKTTLYAHYSAATYTIKFAGTTRSDMTNVGVSAATEITAPTRSDYDFIGWTVTSGLDATKAKFGNHGGSVETEVDDCSKLIVHSSNATSSVDVKNLGIGGATVTLTANWHETCSGGGSSTYNNTCDSVTTFTKDWDISVSGGSSDDPIIENEQIKIKKTSSNGYIYLTSKSSYDHIKDLKIFATHSGNSTNNKCSVQLIGETTYNSDDKVIGTTETTFTPSFTSYDPANDGNKYTIKIAFYCNSSGQSIFLNNLSFTYGSGGTGGDCYYITYHANAADATGSTVDENAYNEDKATATIAECGYTREGYNFVGWTTTEGGTTKDGDYDPKTEVTISADLTLYAVWAEIPKEPKQFELSGDYLGCFSSQEPATLTLDGSESGVTYVLYKDGEATSTSVAGTGSAINFSITEEGTYTVHATRDTYDVTMIGSAEYSKYTVDITSHPEDKSVATGTQVTFSATAKVTSAVAGQYSYQWFSCDDKKYTNPVAVDAQDTAMSSGTQTVSKSIKPAAAGTKYYFCLFTTPCGDTYRTAAAMLRATSSVTTFTWTLDGESTLTTALPQGGRHTVAVASNSVAPSVELVDGCTDVTLGNITTSGTTTTVEVLLGSEASNFSLKASAPASGDYSALEQTQSFTTEACETGEAETIFSMHLTGQSAHVVEGGTITSTSFTSTTQTVAGKKYYKPNPNCLSLQLGNNNKFAVGDKIICDVTGSDNKSLNEVGFIVKVDGTETESFTVNALNDKSYSAIYTVTANSALVGKSAVSFKRYSAATYFYGLSIERNGATSGNTDALETEIAWATPAPASTVTKTASAEPFTYAATADATSLGSLSYTSSVTTVATVDANGKVTIVGEGTTTISVQQVAFGCYAASNTLSYTLTVEGCSDSKPAIAITTGAQTKCPSESVTLTASNYTAGAAFQWYKGNSIINGATSSAYTTTDAGEFYVIATKNCDVESNHITITNKSSDPIVKHFADEFTVKGDGNYYYRIMQLEAGVTASITSAGGMTGVKLVTDANNIVYLKGAGNSVANTANHIVVISVSDACSGSAVIQNVTIHEIPQTSQPSIAWIAEGTKNAGFEEGVKADQSVNVALYKYLQDYYNVTACNNYATTNERDLVAYYSQFDLIVMTDYPNSKTTGGNKVRYTDAVGLLIDHRPILSFEAFVAGCPNWGISTDPSNTQTTQTDLTLLCNAGEIFDDKTDKFKAGNAITVTSVTSGQGLQGFEPLDAPDFTMIGMITDNAVNYIACSERQDNPEARMMVFGLNSNTMNSLTEDGKQMVHGFINYLLIKDEASIPDCSVIFNGNGNDDTWTNTANWEGNLPPNQYATVRIDAPCVVNTTDAKVGNLKIHRSTSDDTYTGSITIPADGALTIYKSLSRILDSKYATLLPTEANDVTVQSTTDGNGALIIGAEEGNNKATVQMASKAYKNEQNKKIWQYIGTPIQDAFLGTDFAGAYTYLWDEPANAWVRKYTEQMIPFTGYGLSQSQTTTRTFTMDGLLNPTSTQKISLSHGNKGMNLLANSWTAPIRITDMTPEDFGDAKQTIYIWNTGRTEVGGSATTSGNANMTAGQWQTIPLETAKQKGWAGDTLIASMQAFEVNTTVTTTLTLDYSRIVMPGKDDKIVPAEMRAPARGNTNDEVDMMRIRVQSEKMLVDQYLLEDERFTTGFDNGWDGSFMAGDGRSASFYSVNAELGNMSVNALPEIEGTILGFVPNDEQVFTISFGYNGEEIYYLNDIVAQRSTAIMPGNTYQFIAGGNEVANRFVISRTAYAGQEISTGIDPANMEVQTMKFIQNNRLFMLVDGVLYDANGTTVY